MNKLISGIIIVIVLLFTSLSWADDSNFFKSWKTTWSEIKTTATNYWNKFVGSKDDSRNPSSTQNDQAMPGQTVQGQAIPGQTAQGQTDSTAQPLAAQTGQSVQGSQNNHGGQAVKQVDPFKQTFENVKAAETHSISKAARAGTANIPKSKSGVPVFTLDKPSTKKGKKISVQRIPYLDIGTEAEISYKDWDFQMPELMALKLEEVKKQDSPEVTKEKTLSKILAVKYEKALVPKKLEKITLALPEGVTLQGVQGLNYNLASEFAVKELSYKDISDDKMNLLKALILAEYAKKCHVAIGYFQTLPKEFNEEENQLKSFYTAACLHEMGFYTDSVPALVGIIKNGSPEYAKKAIGIVLKDLPREYIKEVGGVFKTVNEAMVSEDIKDAFNYYIALSEAMKKKYDQALLFGAKVKHESEKYPLAQYVMVVAEYMSDNIGASQQRQEKLLKELPKYKVEPPLAALIKLNLGRIDYRNKEYRKAIVNYQFIDKDSPLWIQALTEQGWMQLLARDPLGAIGNMHSLQSPYFELIYKPETYVVRTIGYLNICQYGDAYKSLTYLERFYKPWITTIESFKKSTRTEQDYYNYVISMLKTKGKSTDGKLPMTIVKEISRKKEFVNMQSYINNTVDQKNQYGFIRELIKKDQKRADTRISQAQRRIADLNAKINNIKKRPEDQKFLTEWKKSREFEKWTLDYYEFEKSMFAKSYNDYKLFESASNKKLIRISEKLKLEAGENLKSNLVKLEKALNKILENNEFLRYEIFAGSGENIRYVSAGGKTDRKMPVSAEPKVKDQSWDFDGEFWADEIGHYRSSMKDNCPQSISQSKGVN